MTITIGGLGRIRGDTIYASYDPNIIAGYEWSGTNGMTWGTNELYSDAPDTLYIKFNELSSTPYESALAMYDSGCGAFMYHDNQWWTVGVGHSSSDIDGSFFMHPDDPNKIHTTRNVFYRTSIMNGWIKSLVYGSDINEDGFVDMVDLTLFMEGWLIRSHSDWFLQLLYGDNYYRFFNHRSDLNQDGEVNLKDFVIFSRGWLE